MYKIQDKLTATYTDGHKETGVLVGIRGTMYGLKMDSTGNHQWFSSYEVELTPMPVEEKKPVEEKSPTDSIVLVTKTGKVSTRKPSASKKLEFLRWTMRKIDSNPTAFPEDVLTVELVRTYWQERGAWFPMMEARAYVDGIKHNIRVHRAKGE